MACLTTLESLFIRHSCSTSTSTPEDWKLWTPAGTPGGVLRGSWAEVQVKETPSHGLCLCSGLPRDWSLRLPSSDRSRHSVDKRPLFILFTPEQIGGYMCDGLGSGQGRWLVPGMNRQTDTMTVWVSGTQGPWESAGAITQGSPTSRI